MKVLLRLFLLILVALPGMPAECSTICQTTKTDCCCCSSASDRASAPESLESPESMNCCSSDEQVSSDKTQKQHFLKQSSASCEHACATSVTEALTASKIPASQADTADPANSSTFLSFTYATPAFDCPRGDGKMPLFLASNKLYLRFRSLLI